MHHIHPHHRHEKTSTPVRSHRRVQLKLLECCATVLRHAGRCAMDVLIVSGSGALRSGLGGLPVAPQRALEAWWFQALAGGPAFLALEGAWVLLWDSARVRRISPRSTDRPTRRMVLAMHGRPAIASPAARLQELSADPPQAVPPEFRPKLPSDPPPDPTPDPPAARPARLDPTRRPTRPAARPSARPAIGPPHPIRSSRRTTGC